MQDLSTLIKGTITELQVAAYIMSLGYIVSQPLSQDSKYDLLIDVNGAFYRVQVKKARRETDASVMINCRTTTTNVRNCKTIRYTKDEVDFFATYWNNTAFLVPISECASCKSLHVVPPERKTQSYIWDYEARVVLEKL